MNGFMSFMEQKIMPTTQKIAGQRHLLAIRNGVISTLPLTIVGSFFVIFLNLPIDAYMEWIAPFRHILDIPFRFTVGLMALYAAFGVGASLANFYQLNQLSAGLLSVLAFLLASVEPIQITKAVPGVIDAGRYISVGTLSATSLFGAIVTALIPTLVVILLFWGIRYGLKFDVNTTITYLIAPLKSVLVGNNLFGGLLTVFLIVFFWSFGIHGPAILGPIIRPMWDSAILENMEVFTATGNAHQLPNLFTEQFIQWFV